MTLALFGFGFLIKKLLDDRSKKLEINHTLYQQNRIAAIGNFFRNYAAVELMWKQIHIWGIVQNKLTAEEIDKYIWPSINSLKTSVIELQMYFGKEDQALFEKILNNVLDINMELGILMFNPTGTEPLVNRTNKFNFYRDNVFKNNNILLEKITAKVKELFSN